MFAGLRENLGGWLWINCAWENAEMFAIFLPFSVLFAENSVIFPYFLSLSVFFAEIFLSFFVILRHFLRKSAWNFGCLVSTFLEDYLFANLSLEGAEWVGPDNQEYPFKVNFIFKTQSWDGKWLRESQEEIKISQKQVKNFDPPSWQWLCTWWTWRGGVRPFLAVLHLVPQPPVPCKLPTQILLLKRTKSGHLPQNNLNLSEELRCRCISCQTIGN